MGGGGAGRNTGKDFLKVHYNMSDRIGRLDHLKALCFVQTIFLPAFVVETPPTTTKLFLWAFASIIDIFQANTFNDPFYIRR